MLARLRDLQVRAVVIYEEGCAATALLTSCDCALTWRAAVLLDEGLDGADDGAGSPREEPPRPAARRLAAARTAGKKVISKKVIKSKKGAPRAAPYCSARPKNVAKGNSGTVRRPIRARTSPTSWWADVLAGRQVGVCPAAHRGDGSLVNPSKRQRAAAALPPRKGADMLPAKLPKYISEGCAPDDPGPDWPPDDGDGDGDGEYESAMHVDDWPAWAAHNAGKKKAKRQPQHLMKEDLKYKRMRAKLSQTKGRTRKVPKGVAKKGKASGKNVGKKKGGAKSKGKR